MAVKFVDEQEKRLFDTVVLGDDVRAFLSTPVGQLMHARAKALIADARVEALEVDPDNWRFWRLRAKLRKIRLKAELGTAFIEWMAEAIQEGNAAEQQLKEYRE